MDLSMLNPPQRQAAETLEGPVLILAGAGSGKTKALTCRVANLIDHGVRASSILALTFTNKAAKEMKERIRALIGDEAENTWISTFHSTCARILRRDIEKLGYTRSFAIYDEDDQATVLKEILKRLNIDEKYLPIKEISSKISSAKDQLLNADSWFAKTARDYRSQLIHDVFYAYESRMRTLNALDFDDLLLKTLELLVTQPPVLESYRRRFQYVMVDEYQDTSYAQYMLVKLLTDESRNLCVVGDDDQSIYGWRGADIRNILDFEKDYPDAVVIRLEQNYRSTANILDAANQVIANNTDRKDKRLWTESGEGDKIRLYCGSSEREEASWIVSEMKNLNGKGKAFGDMALLYRSNAQSRVPEEMLNRARIPYRIFGGQKFYERKEIKDILGYMKVLANPSDDLNIRRIINVPRRAIGDTTVAELSTWAQDNDFSLYDALINQPETLSPRARNAVSGFVMILSHLGEKKDQMPLPEFVEYLIAYTGLQKQYEKEDTEEARTRIENIREFLGAVAAFANETEQPTLENYLENVSLVTDMDRSEEHPDYVTLMTLHSAKGLEFDTVFILGMEEGIFPTSRAIQNEADPTKIEEERRLCYVGITRAKRHLYLTRATSRTLYNNTNYNPPSRFLEELPKRVLEDLNENQARAARQAYAQRPSYQEMNRTGGFSAASGFGKPKLTLGGKALNIPGVSKGFVPSQANGVAADMSSQYAPGDRVYHRKFGSGTVLSVTGKGGQARIAIDFEQGGTKELALNIAPIIKLED